MPRGVYTPRRRVNPRPASRQHRLAVARAQGPRTRVPEPLADQRATEMELPAWERHNRGIHRSPGRRVFLGVPEGAAE